MPITGRSGKFCENCEYYDKIKCTCDCDDSLFYCKLRCSYESCEFFSKIVGDAVNHPAHYTQGGIECIDALKAATTGLTGIEAFCVGNAIKYLWRFKQKNGVQDLDKAVWYIERRMRDGCAGTYAAR